MLEELLQPILILFGIQLIPFLLILIILILIFRG